MTTVTGEVGFAPIVNTNLNPKQIRMNTILEIVVVEISETIQMIVISVYRPPSTPVDVFMNHMLEIIAQFQHVPTCIVGDFKHVVYGSAICSLVLELSRGIESRIQWGTAIHNVHLWVP